MRISDIDANFKVKSVNEPDVEWFEASETPFSLHGLFRGEDGVFLRIPPELGSSISGNMHWLAYNTAGGRLRFATDSPYVAIKAVIPKTDILPHMTFVGSFGFTLYDGDFFVGMYTPQQSDYENDENGRISFDGIRRFQQKGMHECTLFFPLYNGVKKLYIGLQKGCTLSAAKPYKYPRPAVFYGSSITQGGCTSRSGNDYVSVISKWLDTEIINLGFSGNAKAEPAMADYICGIDASVYVLDYDYNAPDAAFLQKTHLPFYKMIRAQRKETPIVFISKPDFDHDGASAQRREIVKKTYRYAKRSGDKNVYFIDGQSLFGKEHRDLCTVDTCHPNDLGFYRMAEKIAPVIKRILEKDTKHE